MRLTGVTDEVFEIDLPFHCAGHIFGIRVAALVDKGEKTGMYRPLITLDNTPISHDVVRAESIEAAHTEAMRWIQSQYGKK